MLSVCVVGGGAAGAAAAEEAVEAGASVTLIERSEALATRHADWPDLLSPSGTDPDQHSPVEPSEAKVRLGETVLSVSESCSVVTSRGKARFDSVVLASGSRPSFPTVPGLRKPGVFILDSLESCKSVGAGLEASISVVVSGRGIPALRVADRLRGGGRQVTLFNGGRSDDVAPLGEMHLTMERAAADRGVVLVGSQIERAVGMDAVEGVIRGGRVFSCDMLVIVPTPMPRTPQLGVERGQKGGVLVDSGLRSSSKGIYAAGGCAEFGLPLRTRVFDTVASARTSGRVAGANAGGLRTKFTAVRSIDTTVFGLRLASVGLTLEEALSTGNPANAVTLTFGRTAICSVVYRRLDGKVLGIQLVGEPEASHVDLTFAVSRGVSLTELAYGHLTGSTDISLVAQTAREGLRRA